MMPSVIKAKGSRPFDTILQQHNQSFSNKVLQWALYETETLIWDEFPALFCEALKLGPFVILVAHDGVVWALRKKTGCINGD